MVRLRLLPLTLCILAAAVSLPSPANGAAPIIGSIAKAVFQFAGKEVGKIVFKTALKELGIFDINAKLNAGIEDLQQNMERLTTKVNAVSAQIKLQSFENSYRAALGYKVKLDGIVQAVSATVRSGQPMSGDKVVSWTQELHEVVSGLEANLLSSSTSLQVGLLPLIMESTVYAGKVSDLAEYWEEVDALREYFSDVLALAVGTMENIATHLDDVQCGGRRLQLQRRAAGRALSTKYQYTYYASTACRGSGGISDNKDSYYDVVAQDGMSKEACQDRCDRQSSCRGFELSFSGRCEIWKVAAYGYKPIPRFECYVKGSTVPPTPPPTFPPVQAGCPKLTVATYENFYQAARNVVWKMYRLGVPLVENGVVHVQGQPWALGPVNKFSGYYAGVTGDRISSKLETMKSNYDAARHGGKTLEAFLTAHAIPTQYLELDSFKCEDYTSRRNYPDVDTYYRLLVKINTIVSGNSISKPEMVEVQNWIETRKQCERLVSSYKASAGVEYATRNGQVIGGIVLGGYVRNPCRAKDSEWCEPFPAVTTNRKPFFGRFFTWNLKWSDSKRLCKGSGKNSLACNLSGNRLTQHGSRAGLTTDPAIKHQVFNTEFYSPTSFPTPVPLPMCSDPFDCGEGASCQDGDDFHLGVVCSCNSDFTGITVRNAPATCIRKPQALEFQFQNCEGSLCFMPPPEPSPPPVARPRPGAKPTPPPTAPSCASAGKNKQKCTAVGKKVKSLTGKSCFFWGSPKMCTDAAPPAATPLPTPMPSEPPPAPKCSDAGKSKKNCGKLSKKVKNLTGKPCFFWGGVCTDAAPPAPSPTEPPPAPTCSDAGKNKKNCGKLSKKVKNLTGKPCFFWGSPTKVCTEQAPPAPTPAPAPKCSDAGKSKKNCGKLSKKVKKSTGKPCFFWGGVCTDAAPPAPSPTEPPPAPKCSDAGKSKKKCASLSKKLSKLPGGTKCYFSPPPCLGSGCCSQWDNSCTMSRTEKVCKKQGPQGKKVRVKKCLWMEEYDLCSKNPDFSE